MRFPRDLLNIRCRFQSIFFFPMPDGVVSRAKRISFRVSCFFYVCSGLAPSPTTTSDVPANPLFFLSFPMVRLRIPTTTDAGTDTLCSRPSQRGRKDWLWADGHFSPWWVGGRSKYELKTISQCCCCCCNCWNRIDRLLDKQWWSIGKDFRYK